MSATGELIRSMNYVDDIAATLRRIISTSSMMTAEEQKRLADYMKKSDPNFLAVVQRLENAK